MAKRKVRTFPELEAARIESHFLDSGAFSLWTKAEKYGKDNGCSKWNYYETDEFWAYVDGYAEFVKTYKDGIDLYANVDAIPDPELTWRNQRYLEKKHGLSPVPVVHYKTDLKWLKHYMDRGYQVIGLGGLVGSLAQDGCIHWLDRCFDLVCDSPDRTPIVKLHGFGVTGYELLLKYPWWSVDSTTWTKVGAFGGILVPRMTGGRFNFQHPPYIIKVSNESPENKIEGKHYSTLNGGEKKIIEQWLHEIGMTVERVMNNHQDRRASNVMFYERLRKTIPEYPWPFHSTRRKGFNLV